MVHLISSWAALSFSRRALLLDFFEGSEGFVPRVKQPGFGADHSPPSSVSVKNAWAPLGFHFPVSRNGRNLFFERVIYIHCTAGVHKSQLSGHQGNWILFHGPYYFQYNYCIPPPQWHAKCVSVYMHQAENAT